MSVKTIAFYHWAFPSGGAEIVTCNLGRYFHAHNFRMIIYTRQVVPELLTDQMRQMFDIRPLPDSHTMATPANVDFLCESLNREQVDILIAQGTPNTPAREIRKRTNAKIIFCLHSIPFWEVYEWKHKKVSTISRPTLLRKIEFLLLRKPLFWLTNKLEHRFVRSYIELISHIDRFVTLCPDYGRQIQQRICQSGLPGCDLPSGRFTALFNPLLPAQEPIKVPKEKIVLYVGRFQRSCKRVDRLLKIWHTIEKQNPDWKLIILGDGEERGELEQLARRLRLSRVEFAGYQHDITPFYRRASFVCLTSNFEGLPMCFMEGQQYGAIPVTFDSYSGAQEITRNGECGILVPAYNLRKYAHMLSAVMDDPKRQQQLRDNCYQAAARYDLDHIGAQWLRLFNEL